MPSFCCVFFSWACFISSVCILNLQTSSFCSKIYAKFSNQTANIAFRICSLQSGALEPQRDDVRKGRERSVEEQAQEAVTSQMSPNRMQWFTLRATGRPQALKLYRLRWTRPRYCWSCFTWLPKFSPQLLISSRLRMSRIRNEVTRPTTQFGSGLSFEKAAVNCMFLIQVGKCRSALTSSKQPFSLKNHRMDFLTWINCVGIMARAGKPNSMSIFEVFTQQSSC